MKSAGNCSRHRQYSQSHLVVQTLLCSWHYIQVAAASVLPLAAMENTSLPNDVEENVATPSSLYIARINDLALKVIYLAHKVINLALKVYLTVKVIYLALKVIYLALRSSTFISRSSTLLSSHLPLSQGHLPCSQVIYLYLKVFYLALKSSTFFSRSCAFFSRSSSLFSRSSTLPSSLKVIYSLIGTVGIIDNLFVIVIFALFIKIKNKVICVRRHWRS